MHFESFVRENLNASLKFDWICFIIKNAECVRCRTVFRVDVFVHKMFITYFIDVEKMALNEFPCKNSHLLLISKCK